jgi:hypothetical protein
METTCEHHVWDTSDGAQCYLPIDHAGVHQYRNGTYLPDRHDKPGRGDGE